MMRSASPARTAYLLLTLTSLFWSGNFIIGRAIRNDAPPLGLGFWRWAVAASIMLVVSWPHLQRDWPIIRRRWPVFLIFGGVGITLFNAFTYAALQQTTAINAFLMQSLMPVIIVLLSFLLYRERVTRRQSLGVAVSLAGAVMIILQGDWNVLRTLAFNRGDLYAFIAVAGYALYTTLLRQRPTVHLFSFMAATFIVGALLLFPLYAAETLTVRVMPLTWTTVLAVAYVAIFPSILAYFFYNRGVEQVGANRAGLFIHLMPVFGSLLAVIFLGETLLWYHGVGVVLIGLGIWLATTGR